MKCSENIANLSKAMLKAQKKIKNAHFDSTNPRFGSGYASLAEVIDACKTAYNDEGIIITQSTSYQDDVDYLETVLIHAESGENISSTLRLRVDVNAKQAGMQPLGSAITYARRYALQCLGFFTSEADDDGNSTMSDHRSHHQDPPTKIIPTLSQRIDKMVGVFDKDCKVSKKMLEIYLGHPIEISTDDEINTLYQTYLQLKSGKINRDEWFHE